MWGLQTFFASLLGCGWGWYDCIRRIPEEPGNEALSRHTSSTVAAVIRLK
ncbi:MAG: hypothetical protein GVY30_10130 [Chloroflexi bacterium]|nr:hypothetical protein [Chloroflexota bacterium]